MRTLILAIVGTMLAAAAWVVTASALYLWFIGGRFDLFVFPYDQWIEVLPWWNRTGWMEIYVIGSAAVPSDSPCSSCAGCTAADSRGGSCAGLPAEACGPSRAA